MRIFLTKLPLYYFRIIKKYMFNILTFFIKKLKIIQKHVLNNTNICFKIKKSTKRGLNKIISLYVNCCNILIFKYFYLYNKKRPNLTIWTFLLINKPYRISILFSCIQEVSNSLI